MPNCTEPCSTRPCRVELYKILVSLNINAPKRPRLAGPDLATPCHAQLCRAAPCRTELYLTGPNQAISNLINMNACAEAPSPCLTRPYSAMPHPTAPGSAKPNLTLPSQPSHASPREALNEWHRAEAPSPCLARPNLTPPRRAPPCPTEPRLALPCRAASNTKWLYVSRRFGRQPIGARSIESSLADSLSA